MKILLAAAVLIASASGAAQSPSEQTARDVLLRKAIVCMRQAATRLEPSGESPQSIAEAALWACNAERVAVANYMFQNPPGFSNEANERGVAVAQVVGVRLCKKTKDCFFAQIP